MQLAEHIKKPIIVTLNPTELYRWGEKEVTSLQVDHLEARLRCNLCGNGNAFGLTLNISDLSKFSEKMYD